MAFWTARFIVPLILSTAAGFALWLGIDGAFSRRFWPCLLGTLTSLFLALALSLSAYDDPRLPPMLPWEAIAATIALGLAVWGTQRLRRCRAVVAGVLAVSLVLLPLLFNPFSMHVIEDHVAVSPDGRYLARLVYYDGLTYGYYFVVLKPNTLRAWFAAADEVAEADAEGFDGIVWKDLHTLVVQHDSGTGFAQKDRRWRDVTILYEEEK